MQSEPIDLVLFGAGGDLDLRKLLPALMHLEFDELLPEKLRILAMYCEETNVENFMAGQKATLQAYLGEQR